jgi:sulfopyruvate decarboxylase TPP-binding subunit
MVLCSGVADLMVLCCGVAITGPGRLLLGVSGMGNSIRMLMSHFVELKVPSCENNCISQGALISLVLES